MGLADVALQVVGVAAALTVAGLLVVVGPERLQRTSWRAVRSNLRGVAPTLFVLVAILVVNGFWRDAGAELSWLIGANVTGYIYLLEGQFVASLQSFASPALTAYFSAMYIFGYAFLLSFPLVAYGLNDDARPLHVLLLAYALNYGIGVVCYVFFVAYGPRNFMPELVEPLLYTSWPEAQLLTSRVNVNTNVFPSLHTSLSVSVALIAYRFRATYPRWLPVTVVLAASILVSTMYLGIHWATDVVAGVVVAAISVAVANRIDETTLLSSSVHTTDVIVERGLRTFQKLR